MNLALLMVGHLLTVYRIFGYLKQVPKHRLLFDLQKPSILEDRFQKFDWDDSYSDAQEKITLDMPKPGGKLVSIYCFVAANHARDKVTRR